MRLQTISIGVVMLAVLSCSAAASQRGYDARGAYNRTERANRDYYLHKKFYPSDRSRGDAARSPEPQVPPRNAGDGFAADGKLPFVLGVSDRAKDI